MSVTYIAKVQDRNGNPLAGAQFTIFVDGTELARIDSSSGFCTVEVPETGTIEVEASYNGVSKKEKISRDSPNFTIELDVQAPIPEGTMKPIDDRIVFGAGIVLVVISGVLAILFETPSPYQYRIFAGIFALGAGAFAHGLSGMLHAKVSFGKRLAISATGALAVFVLIYFFGPG